MKFSDIHPDIERFLQEDCYCPGEIYDVTGFFCVVYGIDDECELIERSDDMTAVVATTYLHGERHKHPQAIIFWHDEDDHKKIVDAQRFDATDNNIGILRTIVQGGKPDGRKIDEFVPGQTESELSKVLGMCDFVMVD